MFRIPFLIPKPFVDLSGQWTGHYDYDSFEGFATFALNLTQQDGRSRDA